MLGFRDWGLRFGQGCEGLRGLGPGLGFNLSSLIPDACMAVSVMNTNDCALYQYNIP